MITISQVPDYNRIGIKEFFTSSFPWFYTDAIIHDYPVGPWWLKTKGVKPKHQFTHSFIECGTTGSAWTQPLLKLLPLFPELSTHYIWRMKANLQTPYKTSTRRYPHVDMNYDPIALDSIIYLYFPEDSDGPLEIYHNWWRTQRIKPKGGRLVRMPATTWHSGNSPVHAERRTVLNVVLCPKGNRSPRPWAHLHTDA